MLVVGDREKAEGTVSVRTRKGGDQGSRPLEQFVKDALSEIEKRLGEPAAEDATDELNVRPAR